MCWRWRRGGGAAAGTPTTYRAAFSLMAPPAGACACVPPQQVRVGATAGGQVVAAATVHSAFVISADSAAPSPLLFATPHGTVTTESCVCRKNSHVNIHFVTEKTVELIRAIDNVPHPTSLRHFLAL